MSCATSAAESSIDWFWQTTQRNAWPISRARASSAGSFSISDGSTARAGQREAGMRQQQGETRASRLAALQERQDGLVRSRSVIGPRKCKRTMPLPSIR